jgi:hypothetical protein
VVREGAVVSDKELAAFGRDKRIVDTGAASVDGGVMPGER